jgi:predicted nucleic acid-binding protein
MDSSQALERRQAQLRLDCLWREGSGRLSWQVLHEFHANAERKMGLPKESARRVVEVFAQWRPVEMSVGVIQRGWRWMDKALLCQQCDT